MTACERRKAVNHLKSRRVSERRACRVIGFSRSAAWHLLKGRDDEAPRSELKPLAECYPHYGYPTLHDMLKAEGKVINPKRTYRIYREKGLQIGTKKRKNLIRPRVPMLVPEPVNQRWSLNFVSDRLADFPISWNRVGRALDLLARKLPTRIVCDNGPEFTCKAMFFRAKKTGVELHFIQQGKPTQNAFVENFNGKFRHY